MLGVRTIPLSRLPYMYIGIVIEANVRFRIANTVKQYLGPTLWNQAGTYLVTKKMKIDRKSEVATKASVDVWL